MIIIKGLNNRYELRECFNAIPHDHNKTMQSTDGQS